VNGRNEREMTPEEREQFERGILHHEDEDRSEEDGPASESAERREGRPAPLNLPPSPD
jgi:hypothetical protein